MSGPDGPDGSIPDEESKSVRSNAEHPKAGGSSETAGFRLRGRRFPRGRIALTFFEHRYVFVRRVEIEGGLSEEAQTARIAEAMRHPDWHKMEITELEDVEVDQPLAPVVDLPTARKGWGARWGQPSERTLDMERDEPGLFASLKARAASYWKFPFGKGDSE